MEADNDEEIYPGQGEGLPPPFIVPYKPYPDPKDRSHRLERTNSWRLLNISIRSCCEDAAHFAKKSPLLSGCQK